LGNKLIEVHNMTGVYNLFLFQSQNNRPARDKLSNMGGIMSSSEELMNVAMPIINRAMTPPSPPPTPPTQSTQSMGMQQPPPMPPAFPTMPNMRNNESVTTNPDQQNNINPSNTPVVPQQNKPMGMMAGALVPLIQAGRALKPIIQQGARGAGNLSFKRKAPSRELVPVNNEAITKKTISDKGFLSKLAKVGIPAASAGALIISGLDFLENKLKRDEPFTKKEDELLRDSIPPGSIPNKDEMNTKDLASEYLRVAKNTSIADPGSFAERFGKSMLLGMAAKMEGMGTGSDAEQSRQNYLYNAIYTATFTEALKQNPDNPQLASQIARQAAVQAAPLAIAARTTQPNDRSGGGGDGIPTTPGTRFRDKETNEIFIVGPDGEPIKE
jgi:hypothetical protein